MTVAPSATSLLSADPAARMRIGILSTYPPTPCGLATFSAALADALTVHGAEVQVVRVADGTETRSSRVVGELANDRLATATTAVELLNACDIAMVQHEYGVYGGVDGDEVVEILRRLRVPSIVIAHTVLSQPTAHQREVLAEIAELSDRVVVMSNAARDRMRDRFGVDPAKIDTIPHGAFVPRPASRPSSRRPMLLTWGLVGPGKGIERVIEAMTSLRELRPRPRYLVAGQTHPKVLAAIGESYRDDRIRQAARNGVADSVAFDAVYRDVPSLASLIQSSTAVVLPYDSHDQATSGVLIDAIAAGRPVVATAFPHAVEMLATGAGIVVDHDDPDAMVRALTTVLTDRSLVAEMTAEAQRLAPALGWSVVARSYLEVAQEIRAGRSVGV